MKPGEIDDPLRFAIDAVVSDNWDLAAAFEILSDFMRKGGTQADALRTLEVMREASSEDYQDRVLEVMDIVSGFCRPAYKIWP